MKEEKEEEEKEEAEGIMRTPGIRFSLSSIESRSSGALNSRVEVV